MSRLGSFLYITTGIAISSHWSQRSKKRFQYRKPTPKVQKLGLKMNSLDTEMLEYMLRNMDIARGTAEEQVKEVTRSLSRGCDAREMKTGEHQCIGGTTTSPNCEPTALECGGASRE